MLRFRSPTLSAIAALAVGVSFIHAADEVPTIEQRLQALDQEVKILKRKAEISAEEAAAKAVTAKDAPKFTANQKDGFSLSSADGAYKLRIGGSAQIEGLFFLSEEEIPVTNASTNTFFVRRVRPSFEGTVAKYFDYQLVLDFSPTSTNTASVLDANVTANIDPSFKVKAGRFKVPFGLEFLQSDPYTAFIERGLPSQLVPQRDVGLQASGDVLDGILSYQIGIFNGASDRSDRDADTGPVNGADNQYDDDKEGAVRLYAAPFKNSGISVLQGLNLGIAGTYGHTEGPNRSAYQSPGANGIFTLPGTTFIDGERSRFSPQLYYTLGAWDVLAEYVSSSVDLRTAATASRTVTNTAWQVESGFVLTGEDAGFKGLSPAGGGIGGSGWGAVQLVARVAELNLDDENFYGPTNYASAATNVRSAFDIGVGVNWWLNRNVKIAANYDHTTFEAGGGGTNANPVDREDEEIIRARIQLIF